MASIGPKSTVASAEDSPSVSVVVVSFNTCQQLRNCLNAIEPIHEVIVVDNGSSDGSPDMVKTQFPHVRLIGNAVNRGFGAANNQGIDAASGEFVLFLNSDCYAQPGAISLLANTMRDELASVAGGRLLNPNGTLQQSAARMLQIWHVVAEQTGLEKLVHTYWCTPWADVETPVQVGQVMGACLMVRRGDARFDEDYFLYCEDTDLVRRIVRRDRDEGRPGIVLYVPKARFIHELGASSEGGGRWLAVARYNRGKELYFFKHSGPLAGSVCWILNRMGALARLLIWTLATVISLFLWRPATLRMALWARVLTAPLSGPRLP